MVEPLDPSGIAELVRRAIAGDVDAYGELYRSYMDRIFRYVFYQVGNKTMAEDITEEVFLKSWKSIKSCRGRETTFGAWIYRIAHNHAVDCLRKNHREVPVSEVQASDSSDPACQVENGLEWEKVREAVARLPELQKQIIYLKFLEGVDNREIEAITGKRQGAIRALQMRALSNLRRRMAAGGDSVGG